MWRHWKQLEELMRRLKEANGRLKAGRFKVSIECLGEKLFLRATLPPRSGNRSYQQRISIAAANTNGIKIAESEAKKLRVRLDSGLFSWADYEYSTPKPKTIGEWISAFEQDYFERRPRNYKTLTTWEKDYIQVFKTLPPNKILTPEILKKAVVQTQPDTRTRKRYCIVLGALSKFADIDFNPKPFAGKYSSRRVAPRHLPSDSEIVKWFFKIPDLKWQWVYGVIATYGLRNHEAFFLENSLTHNLVATVFQGKTGYRKVWPCHPEWHEQFNLREGSPPVIKLDRSNSDIGNAVTKYFHQKIELPFKVFDMRHCWAIRTLEYGLEVSLAARQMGHSTSVHTDLYHHWIDERHHQKAFELLMLRTDRPLPPEFPTD